MLKYLSPDYGPKMNVTFHEADTSDWWRPRVYPYHPIQGVCSGAPGANGTLTFDIRKNSGAIIGEYTIDQLNQLKTVNNVTSMGIEILTSKLYNYSRLQLIIKLNFMFFG